MKITILDRLISVTLRLVRLFSDRLKRDRAAGSAADMGPRVAPDTAFWDVGLLGTMPYGWTAAGSCRRGARSKPIWARWARKQGGEGSKAGADRQTRQRLPG